MHSNAIKKTTTTTSTATRRPALGNLVNRTDKARPLNDKKVTNSNGSNENCNSAGGTGIDLKHVKARVDTHWKNEPLRKPTVTRNNSIKKSSLTGISSLVSQNSGPKLVKIKTTEAATVKEVKLVDKSGVLKRQDSTLTRRRVITGTKTGAVDTTKKTVTRTKSTESESGDVAPKFIADIPVVQSRFRPPAFSSYSNGLINGVSIFSLFSNKK